MIKLDGVSKKFATGTFGLSEINLAIDKGEFVFLVGATGSGKTTLFRILIRDLVPSEGKVRVGDLDVSTLPKSKLTTLRKMIGVVFQDLKLLNDRTIFENVVLPLDVSGETGLGAAEKVEKILRKVGIFEHKDKFPVQLSGGELQRTAIARALVLSPQIILADEPTGNLDAATSWEIVKILSDINKEGTTVIMATHNTDIVKSMDMRTIHIDRGKIVKDENIKHVVIKEKEKDEKGENKDDKEVKEKGEGKKE
ncbi:MAG: cell division ATP-binding protein FtsE [Candidatus Levybacteria bacterium RIFCSPHIGHO2_01_FULL_37_17]|nr:MAG: cell division ATP-binding protein FtsE [Candidatus Levybacteria bacterium RIFCSPHIGHO2_01_FULL_37_17]OGH37132.1 MAG: cell division ATP-binding protein FtsE [Candidatus Levybacteria bacterium RIFCSPLOWO2_01_FULL_38_23]